MARGPHRCNLEAARNALERAIELNNTGDIPLEESYCEIASRSLSLLEGAHAIGFGPRRPFGDGYAPDDDDDTIGAEEDSLLGHLLATIPPELRRELEEQGVNPLDALRALAGIMGDDLT
jgi:hypothetical protein